MRTFKAVITIITTLSTLAVAIPSTPQYTITGNEVVVMVDYYVFSVIVPPRGWGKMTSIRGVVEKASILHAEKDVKCFLWGSQEIRNSRSGDTRNINYETYISSFFTNNQPFVPEAQDLSALPYSEVFCYDVSPFTNPNLAVVLLENVKNICYVDVERGRFESGAKLVLVSLDSSGEGIHNLDHESGQTPDVDKITLIDVPNPNVGCRVVGKDGEELISRMGNPSEQRLVRDTTHIHCEPRGEDEEVENSGEEGV